MQFCPAKHGLKSQPNTGNIPDQYSNGAPVAIPTYTA